MLPWDREAQHGGQAQSHSPDQGWSDTQSQDTGWECGRVAVGILEHHSPVCCAGDESSQEFSFCWAGMCVGIPPLVAVHGAQASVPLHVDEGDWVLRAQLDVM